MATPPSSSRFRVTALAFAGVSVAAWLFWPSSGPDLDAVPTFPATRGPLQVAVLQGGEIRALHNHEVKSEIESATKILSIIPEGYLVTDEDVKEGKILVELDSTDLKARIEAHEIEFQSTVASYIEADEGREIQRSENQSFVRDYKEASTFALMDFEKYLGREIGAKILEQSNLPSSVQALDRYVEVLETQSNAALDPAVLKNGAATKLAKAKTAVHERAATERIEFGPYLRSSGDGEATQKLRQLEDDLLVRKAELAVAKQKVEASQRLHSKQFIPRAQLENDQVTFEKVSLSVKTATTQLALFRSYEFAKQCALLLSAYRESLTKLERMVRSNRSRMAQAETRFQTSKRRYEVEMAQREALENQLKACTIRATQPGLVAYGDLDASSSYNYSNSIEEGATVRLRQTILTIPDMNQMGVHVRIHESQVKKVKLGQMALIRVDAEPGKVLQGRVAELALMPDSSSSRYTPNLKVYPCTVHIEGRHAWLKPGMNAKVEIIVDQLSDVVFVPLQSIEVEQDEHFCYVRNQGELQRRAIKTGVFNDEFIEVRDGVEPGDEVALALPKKQAAEDAASKINAAPAKAQDAVRKGDSSAPAARKGVAAAPSKPAA